MAGDDLSGVPSSLCSSLPNPPWSHFLTKWRLTRPTSDGLAGKASSPNGTFNVCTDSTESDMQLLWISPGLLAFLLHAGCCPTTNEVRLLYCSYSSARKSTLQTDNLLCVSKRSCSRLYSDWGIGSTLVLCLHTTLLNGIQESCLCVALKLHLDKLSNAAFINQERLLN